MNDEDIKQFCNAFEDFMKHADMEMSKYVYESPDGGKTVYRRKHGDDVQEETVTFNRNLIKFRIKNTVKGIKRTQ